MSYINQSISSIINDRNCENIYINNPQLYINLLSLNCHYKHYDSDFFLLIEKKLLRIVKDGIKTFLVCF